MNDIIHNLERIKTAVGGIVTFTFGIVLIVSGDLHSIVAGSGAILAAMLTFAFVGFFALNRGHSDIARLDHESQARNPTQVIWLGIALTLVPGLLYFYLKYAMSRFDPGAIIFVSVPLLISGLGCIGVGFWSSIKSESKGQPDGKAEGSHDTDS